MTKRIIKGRNNVTRVSVERRSCDQGRCKNVAFTIRLRYHHDELLDRYYNLMVEM